MTNGTTTLTLSEAGRRLATAIRNYGIRVVDKGGSGAGAIRMDQDAVRGSLPDDMLKIYPHIRMCDLTKSTWSNVSTPFGGGTALSTNSALV